MNIFGDKQVSLRKVISYVLVFCLGAISGVFVMNRAMVTVSGTMGQGVNMNIGQGSADEITSGVSGNYGNGQMVLPVRLKNTAVGATNQLERKVFVPQVPQAVLPNYPTPVASVTPVEKEEMVAVPKVVAEPMGEVAEKKEVKDDDVGNTIQFLMQNGLKFEKKDKSVDMKADKDKEVGQVVRNLGK